MKDKKGCGSRIRSIREKIYSAFPGRFTQFLLKNQAAQSIYLILSL
ncbi:MAG: hypothetical protein KAW12_21095 [Candidatus Aminicenantes bacterium]|nr:hypothetical protein [Candidatus Aminicenantes bacterium]